MRQYPGSYTGYLLALDTPREKMVKASPVGPRQKKLKFSFKEHRKLEAALKEEAEPWLYLTCLSGRIEKSE